MEFEIERRACVDRRGLRNDPRNSVADYDIPSGEQAFVAFRMGCQPSGEIVERVVVSIDKPSHGGAKARLDLADSSAGPIEIGRQYRRPQPSPGEIEAMARRPQALVGGEPQALGAVVEALCRGTDQVLRIGQAAREPGEMQPTLDK
jgi:hypothetical protein